MIELIYCNQLCLENIALHKAAWQQTPFNHDEFNASLAVDGRKENLHQWGGECVASGKNNTAEWRVDLESVLSIHHIVIQYIQSKAVWGIYCCFLAYFTYIYNFVLTFLSCWVFFHSIVCGFFSYTR